MTNIEQEFFEAFGIEKQYKCDSSKTHNKGGQYKGLVCNSVCKECYFKVLEYPHITPEIVLGLIKIIICKDYTFNIWETDMFTNNDKYIANASNSVRHDIYGRANTFNDTVLSLCIQLKHELQSEVKELFNEQ